MATAYFLEALDRYPCGPHRHQQEPIGVLDDGSHVSRWSSCSVCGKPDIGNSCMFCDEPRRPEDAASAIAVAPDGSEERGVICSQCWSNLILARRGQLDLRGWRAGEVVTRRG